MQELLGSNVHWATISEEQSSVYITRITVSLAILVMLTSEHIHLDPKDTPYRKAVLACLVVIACLVSASFAGYIIGEMHLQLVCYKVSEGLWVLVNSTVAHFPSRILSEPPERLQIFFYFSALLVIIAGVLHYASHRSFNVVYIANVIVSGYTLTLLGRLTSMLRTAGQCLKAAECLCRAEYVIILLNIVIILLTACVGTKAYYFKGCLFVMYWIRMHFLLVEYGRRFVVQLGPASESVTSGKIADAEVGRTPSKSKGLLAVAGSFAETASDRTVVEGTDIKSLKAALLDESHMCHAASTHSASLP
mmetsp:Transcript_10704/g.24397  ORF Transcript_10704/g.24397 Transcript_10704/m.24397 type:complete len:306 (+) Transcript_10704:58-975(+)